jgi:hypothetical protein
MFGCFLHLGCIMIYPSTEPASSGSTFIIHSNVIASFFLPSAAALLLPKQIEKKEDEEQC